MVVVDRLDVVDVELREVVVLGAAEVVDAVPVLHSKQPEQLLMAHLSAQGIKHGQPLSAQKFSHAGGSSFEVEVAR